MSLKNKFKESGKLFRDVMVVVIGIAITFSLNTWISKKNEMKEVQQYLNAVKMELEINLKTVENFSIYHLKARNLSNYLESCKPDAYQLDSLNYYWEVIILNYNFFPITSAFEMFKYSGAMRLLKDKEFLASVWYMYGHFEFLKISIDNYNQNKDVIKNNFFLSVTNDIHTQTDLAYRFSLPEAQQYISFLKVWGKSSRPEDFLSAAKQIEKILEAIERIN